MDRDERSFRQLVDELPDLVCRIALDGTLLYVNHAYADYFGTSREELVGRSFLELVPEDTRDELTARLHRLADELTPGDPMRVGEHRGGDAGSHRRWQQWVDKGLFDDDGRLVDVLCVGRDVTERVCAEERVRYHSQHDTLTGLLNRRCTLEALDLAVTDARRTGRPLGVLYIDLDDLKHVNDRFGHRVGDHLIAEVARSLGLAVRQSDTAGRIGGDEFVVVCPAIGSMADLHEVAARITERFAALARPVRASIGAVLLGPGEYAQDLLHRADEAMYAIKLARRRAYRNTG